MYKIYTIIHVHGNYTSLLITGIYNIQFELHLQTSSLYMEELCKMYCF